MIAQVGAPLEMGSHVSFDPRNLKELAMFSGGKSHGIL